MRNIAFFALLVACAASTHVNAEDITNRLPRVMGGQLENTLPRPSGGTSLPSSVKIAPNTTLNSGTGASKDFFPRGSGQGVNVRITR
jgi:hypothetical protein